MSWLCGVARCDSTISRTSTAGNTETIINSLLLEYFIEESKLG